MRQWPARSPAVMSIESAQPQLRLRPALALQIALLLLLVANLGRIPVLSTGDREAPLLVNDLCVIAVLAFGALGIVNARRLRLDGVGIAAALFAGVGLISALIAVPKYGLTGFELVVSLAYLARWLVYFGLYVVVVNVVRRGEVGAIWKAFEAMLLAFASFGILQAALLPGFAQKVYPDSRLFTDWDPQGHRLVSTVLEPNIAAALLLMGLFVQLGMIAAGAPLKRWKPALLFLAIVLTLSRSAALALVAGVGVIFIARGLSRRMLRILAVVGVALAIAAPRLLAFATSYGKLTIGGSALARVVAWLRALAIWRDSPLLGVGFNTYGFVAERYGFDRLGAASYSADGGLLFIGVMTGVVGLAVYIAMLVLVLRRCRSIWRDGDATAQERGLAIGVAALTVALCVDSISVNSLLTTFVMEPLWVLWGLTFALRPRAVVETPAALDATRPASRVPRLLAIASR